jgi:hypothetical protein
MEAKKKKKLRKNGGNKHMYIYLVQSQLYLLIIQTNKHMIFEAHRLTAITSVYKQTNKHTL